MDAKDFNSDINPTPVEDLPWEFRKNDNPFGIPLYKFFRIWFAVAHLSSLYCLLVVIPSGRAPFSGYILAAFFAYLTGLGTTVGSHRYWTHRTFKANKALQILLMILQTAGIQMSIFKWCRDHRAHHKYADTDADPHNSHKGFWFSHMTWKMYPYHPEAKKALNIVDLSDLARDPIVKFQSKYYFELVAIFAIGIPIALGKYLYPELTLFDIWSANMLRIAAGLHVTFLVNSIAHMYGDRPYDKNIRATDSNIIQSLMPGEGWHNFHHAFPWDYASSEFGAKINIATAFINFFAWIGFAWDLKAVSTQMLIDRINRTGDESHPLFDKEKVREKKKETLPNSWGWGDKANRTEDVEITTTLFNNNKMQGFFVSGIEKMR